MRRNKKIAAVAAGALVLGSAGVAYAYWTTSGSGTGTGSTEAGATALTITQDTPLEDMFPGDQAQAIRATVANPGPASYSVSSVLAYLTVDKADGVSGTCNASDYRLNNVAGADEAHAQALAWTPQELAANGSDKAAGTIQFNNKSDANQDACKGATVTIHYVAN